MGPVLVEGEVVDFEELRPSIQGDAEALFASNLKGEEGAGGGEGASTRARSASSRIRVSQALDADQALVSHQPIKHLLEEAGVFTADLEAQ
jgi:hypothetical protein